MIRILPILLFISCQQVETKPEIQYEGQCKEVRRLIKSQCQSCILLYGENTMKKIKQICGKEIYVLTN